MAGEAVISLDEALGIRTISIHDDSSHFPDKSEELNIKEAEYFNREDLCFSEHDINRLVLPNQYHVLHI